MRNIVLPDNKPRRLAFYLAMEELIAQELPADKHISDDYFFTWRVPPTVICGRNQDIPKEVNLDYCRAEGIDVVRRRSGGGCVYADLNNIMFSYITVGNGVEKTFSHYTAMVAGMLRSLGFDAVATGRNDLLIGDRKVSGNAFYSLADRSIVHGTMLCDIDFERMSKAITPSRAKLESKAVKSVQSRITCLKAEGLKMTVEEFDRYAVDYLTDGEPVVLSQEQLVRIEELEQRYYDADFFNGRHHRAEEDVAADIAHTVRVDGVGEFTVEIWLTGNGLIDTLNLSGDFFVLSSIKAGITKHLKGKEYTREAVATALESTKPHEVISGLSKELLLNILFNTI